MIAALLGVIGVLVGALLAVTLQYLLSVRNEFGAATAAARLVIAELNLLIDAVESGDVGDGSLLETPAWDKHRVALAVVLPDQHWNTLANAYRQLAGLRNRSSHQQPNRQKQQSQFSQAASSARDVLERDTEDQRPLHRRGSPLERLLARWPDVDDLPCTRDSR